MIQKETIKKLVKVAAHFGWTIEVKEEKNNIPGLYYTIYGRHPKNNMVPVILVHREYPSNILHALYSYLNPLTKEKLLEILPHGAGIDATWRFEETDNKIIASNKFHLMNDNGYYIGWVPFTAEIDPHAPHKMELEIDPSGFDEEEIGDLEDYLDETIYDSISSYIEKQLRNILY